ncbi:hypothetical protein D3C73_958790 [compost metagenome]
MGRQQQPRLGAFHQLGVPLLIGGALGQRLTFFIQQAQFNRAQCRAAIQSLGKHVQTVMITVQRNADITESEQGRRVGISVMPGLLHHRQVDTRLL